MENSFALFLDLLERVTPRTFPGRIRVASDNFLAARVMLPSAGHRG
jgi:hypothetical protein